MYKLLILLLLVFIYGCSNPPHRQDERAIEVLNAMGVYIGNLESASFTVNTSLDVDSASVGVLQRNRCSDVYLVGPDKMYVYTEADRGRYGLWYNGKTLTFYSFDKKLYDKVPAPPNIIETIDSLNSAYGIEFPAADFLYPTFTTDLLEHNPTLLYLGKSNIDGVPCYHLMASNSESTTQIWISSTGEPIPTRLLITDAKRYSYEATISNWVGSPQLDSSMFEFVVPEGAKTVSLKTVIGVQQ